MQLDMALDLSKISESFDTDIILDENNNISNYSKLQKEAIDDYNAAKLAY
jgi:hypothetical protein